MIDQSYKDALGEFANIGAGHAASSLASLIGARKIMSFLPSFYLARELRALSFLEGRGTVAWCDAAGEGISFRLLVTFEADAVVHLCDKLLGAEGAADEIMLQSMVSEVANLSASAFLNASAKLLDRQLLPSPPSVRRGRLEASVREALPDARESLLIAVPLEALGGFRCHVVVVAGSNQLVGLCAALGLEREAAAKLFL